MQMSIYKIQDGDYDHEIGINSKGNDQATQGGRWEGGGGGFIRIKRAVSAMEYCRGDVREAIGGVQ